MGGGGGGGVGSKGTPDVYIPRGAGPGMSSTATAYPGQQQQWGGGGGGGGPGYQPGMGAAFGVNEATAAMGMQFGSSAMRAGHDYVERNVRPPSLSLFGSVSRTDGRGPDLALCAGDASQALFQRVQLLRLDQAPHRPVPLASPALVETGQEERGLGPVGGVPTPARGHQLARRLHPWSGPSLLCAFSRES